MAGSTRAIGANLLSWNSVERAKFSDSLEEIEPSLREKRESSGLRYNW